MRISAGRKRLSSTGPSRRSNEGSLPRISDLIKRERASETWLSVLRREIASSNLRKNVFFILGLPSCVPADGVPSARCHQRMLAIDFNKRKVSSLNIAFIAANRLRVSQSAVSTRIHSPKTNSASHSLYETRRAPASAGRGDMPPHLFN
jgi:hypothetical protein